MILTLFDAGAFKSEYDYNAQSIQNTADCATKETQIDLLGKK